MNNVYKKRIRDFVLKNHDDLCRRLPREKGLKTRNGSAHCYWCLNQVWHVDTLNDIPDKDYDMVMKVLQMIIDYAEDPDIMNRLPVLYKDNKKINNLSDLL